MKNVLIISYYFPPAGGSAVQRVTKFVKYLGQFGWQPVVLTARAKDFSLRDESMLADIPRNVVVYRTVAPDLYYFYGKLGQKEQKEQVEISAMAVQEGRGSGLKKIALTFRSLFFIPDARVGWLPFALIKGIRIIRKEKVRIIFTTSPPFTTALIGGLLSKITGIPWVSDYRDPWTQAYFYYHRPRITQLIENSMEKWLLNRAATIISINHFILNNLADKYHLTLSQKQAIIPNGFDLEDFIGLRPTKTEKFTIMYTGTINTKMNPEALFQAITQLGRSKPDLIKDFSLVFIGRIGPDVMPMFRDPDIQPIIQLIPQLSHQECLKQILSADLLLLLIPQYDNNSLIMTNKLFEYMYSGIPILCLDDKGLAAETIRKTRTGFTLNPKNINALKDTILECYHKWQKNIPILATSINQDEVKRYDRRVTSQQLAALFKTVLEK